MPQTTRKNRDTSTVIGRRLSIGRGPKPAWAKATTAQRQQILRAAGISERHVPVYKKYQWDWLPPVARSLIGKKWQYNKKPKKNPPKQKFKKDDSVRVPHKGKTVRGKVVRYDKGDPHGWPYYVVDVGEYASIKVPIHKVGARNNPSRPRNPWAICRASETKTGQKWPRAKFERCVMKVKQSVAKKNPLNTKEYGEIDALAKTAYSAGRMAFKIKPLPKQLIREIWSRLSAMAEMLRKVQGPYADKLSLSVLSKANRIAKAIMEYRGVTENSRARKPCVFFICRNSRTKAGWAAASTIKGLPSTCTGKVYKIKAASRAQAIKEAKRHASRKA